MVTKKQLHEMNREMIAELQKTPAGRKELVDYMQAGCTAMLVKAAIWVFLIWFASWACCKVLDCYAKYQEVTRQPQEHSAPQSQPLPQPPISEQT